MIGLADTSGFGSFDPLAQPLLNHSENVSSMIEGLFNQTNYVAAKKLLDVTALRQEAIASNIANVETPHYKRIDVARSFSTEFGQTLASKDAARIAEVTPTLAADLSAVATRRDGNTPSTPKESAWMWFPRTLRTSTSTRKWWT